MSLYDVVIIGAGPSGLGVAQSLEKNNISNYVNERPEPPERSW